LLLNLFAVVYILWTKRLFGVRGVRGFRGGRTAYDAERHSASLFEVERAAA
jgi:3-mercaptopyruvate sulfurtransferase SseA